MYAVLRQKPGVYSYIPARKGGASFSSRVRYHNMDFPLRPGERASVCFGNEGAWFDVGEGRKPMPLSMIPPHFGNGAVVYEPSAPSHIGDAENVAIERTADGGVEHFGWPIHSYVQAGGTGSGRIEKDMLCEQWGDLPKHLEICVVIFRVPERNARIRWGDYVMVTETGPQGFKLAE